METDLVTLERTEDTKGRKIYSPEQRDRLVAEYDASGLTQARFAKQTGAKYVMLVTWLRQRRMRVGQRRPGGMKFEKLELPNGAAPRAGAEAGIVVTLPDGMRIEGKRPGDVAALLRALRR